MLYDFVKKTSIRFYEGDIITFLNDDHNNMILVIDSIDDPHTIRARHLLTKKEYVLRSESILLPKISGVYSPREPKPDAKTISWDITEKLDSHHLEQGDLLMLEGHDTTWELYDTVDSGIVVRSIVNLKSMVVEVEPATARGENPKIQGVVAVYNRRTLV